MIQIEYINKTLRASASRPAFIALLFEQRGERRSADFLFDEPGVQEEGFPLDDKNCNLLVCIDNRLSIATSLNGLPLRVEDWSNV